VNHRPHLRARLTREGWYYLAVLMFIVSGAALTHVNLLVVLGGLMLAPLLINWRLALANVRGVQVRRRPLRPMPAGQSFFVEFEITNPRRWLAAWLLAVEDRWAFDDVSSISKTPRTLVSWLARWLQWQLGPPTETMVTALAMQIPPGETARVNYELVIRRRGLYVSRALRWRSAFPLGLVEALAITRQETSLLALPRIGRLSGEWTHLIEGALAGDGERSLKQRANEGDYFAVRPWQSGDSTRWMHWRTTARAGRPMVRQFEREASPTIALVLDPYLPDEPSSGDRARCEAAISFVATALMDLAQRDVGQLAVLVANQDQPLWIGSRSPLFLEQVMLELAQVSGHSSDHRQQAHDKLAAELPVAACVLVVSSRPRNETSALATGNITAIHVGSHEFSALYSIE
jgi:uncharacterized protein (DUF58 family)